MNFSRTMTALRTSGIAIMANVTLLGTACSGSTTSTTATDTGGSGEVTSGGGANPSGGANPGGGASSIGGGTSAPTGGAFSVGGAAPATGGIGAVGGRPGTGGTSGPATGGNTQKGGSSATGGSAALVTGGSSGVGGTGTSATGGTKAATGGAAPVTGGATSTTPGGSKATGGATATTGGTKAAGGNVATTGGMTSTGTSICGVTPTLATGKLQMEDLCRGVVAVRSGSNNFVSWRIMGYEPSTTTYNVYRSGTKVASELAVGNYLDSGAPSTATYTVRAVINGVEQGDSSNSRTGTAPASTWANNYIDIPLTPPAGGTDTEGTAYTYDANDGMVGDLDGDGEYEIVLKWDPTDAKDNSQSGHTGKVYLDAYKLSGTRLWRIDLGVNIRAGAHYSQPVVYDFDGDGKAEVAVKTAPGTKDATGAYLSLGPAASDTDTTDYRNSSGYILSGPEYLTVFNGATGKEMATVNFVQARGTYDWGDDYGNRVDRFLSSAAFVSDTGSASATSGKPAILMARGYYLRATVTAYTWRNNTLSTLWEYDSGSSTSATSSAYAQGAHSMMVADTDGDLAQEIIYGSATIDSDGKFKCSTGFGHGDALHVGDLVPTRNGLEVFMPHEDKTKATYDVHDANTCAVIVQGAVTGSDNGRGVADDVDSSNSGAEFWSSADGNLHSATSGATLGSKPGSTNFLIYWDGDETRELEDANHIDKYSGGSTTNLLTCSSCASNNGTKSTPVLTADLFGDWREEIIWRLSNNSALRIYTTTATTTRRIYTLMHDPQYRMQVSSEQAAYNQPPHTSFRIGAGMSTPPTPDISVK
jgi:rhamnogalacturonan endolyase